MPIRDALTGRSALPPLADEQQRKDLSGEQDKSGKGRDSGTSDQSAGSGSSGGSGSSNGTEQAKRVQAAMEAHAHVLVMHPITLKFQTLGGPLSVEQAVGNLFAARRLAWPNENPHQEPWRRMRTCWSCTPLRSSSRPLVGPCLSHRLRTSYLLGLCGPARELPKPIGESASCTQALAFFESWIA